MKKLFLTLLLSHSLTSFSQDFKTLFKQLDQAYQKDDYAAAKKLIPAAIASTEKEMKDSAIWYCNMMLLCGNIHFSVEEYPEAEKYYQVLRERSKIAYGEEDELYALGTFNLARVYSEQGRYAEAEPLYLKALPPLAKVYGAGSPQYTRLFNSLARMYIDMGRWAEAESMEAAVVNYFKEKYGNENEEYLAALGCMGIIYQNQRRYYESEEMYKALINYFRQLPERDPENFSTLLNNIGELYRVMGKYEQAEPAFVEALAITRKLEKQKPIASTTVLNNLSLVYKAQGRYPEAEAGFKEALKVYRAAKMNNHPDYTNPLNNLGDLFRIMGRLQEAVDAFEEVIAIREKLLGENHVNYANAINNMALVYTDIGNYDEAEKRFLKAKDIYKKLLGRNDRLYSNCCFNLSIVYSRKENFEYASSYCKEALDILRENFGENNDKYAMYLKGLGGIYFRGGKNKEAIEAMSKSLTIFKTLFSENHYEALECELNLSYMLSTEAKYKEAEPYCLHAMKGYSKLITDYFPVLSEKEKMAFYNQLFIPLETAKSFAVTYARKRPRENHDELFGALYDFQLLGKSLLLNESARSRSVVLSGKDTSLTRLYKRVEESKRKLMELYRLSNDELTALKIDIRSAEKETNALENELAVQMAGKGIQAASKITWQDVRKELKQGEAALEMVCIQNSGGTYSDTAFYAALIITPSSMAPKMVIINNGQALETKYLPAYQKAIRSMKGDDESYNHFWKPIAKELGDAKRVYFSSDGAYEKLSLNTLKNPATGKFLLEETDIVLLTNTRDLLAKEEKKKNANFSAELFGFPDYEFTGLKKEKAPVVTASLSRYGFTRLEELPGTKAEVEAIADVMVKSKWKVNQYMGGDASEKQIKEIESPSVLHVATHGFFLKNGGSVDGRVLGFNAERTAENPLLRSGIILAGAAAIARDTVFDTKREDGILTAYEASNLNLSGTSLVVLSACETGLGDVVNGQGVYGLQRAFFVAGARSIVMSLWPVDDDATRELMITFYYTWLQDPSPENRQKAFRTAQLKLKEKYPSPYFWGAFIMIGK